MTRPPTPDDDSSAPGSVPALVGALEVLRARVGALRLPLDVVGAEQDRTTRAALVDQLDDYLLPRLRGAEAPVLVVVGGSTGAGKSTLVNSLLGETVSMPGVLRPTTRAPVLVHHPLDARWFDGDRVLPRLARITGERAGAADADGTRALRLVASPAVPRGLALVDAPDVDSVALENRALAARLFAAADLWVFLTTAARYADAVPWELLGEAAGRRAQVAVVIDRVDPGAGQAVDDLRRMMDEHGLGGAVLFEIAEDALTDGLLSEQSVAPLATWLDELGGDESARAEVVTTTRDGVVADVVRRAGRLASAADAQRTASARLRTAVETAHAQARESVRHATTDGSMLRGEVLARWQDFVGTGEFFRGVEQGVGRVRDRVGGFLRGRPARAPQVEEAIAHGLEAVIVEACETAATRAFTAWREDPAGRALADPELARAAAGVRTEVAANIRAWQADVLELVREQGQERRGMARALSFGLNGVGVSLMVLVFASTGGLTGAEIGIAGGTALAAQKLLEAVFGDEAVRRLTRLAHERLDDRVTAVLAAQAERYTAQLDALGAGESGGEPLRAAAGAVAEAAAAERVARPSVRSAARAAPTGSLRGAGLAPAQRPSAGTRDDDGAGGAEPVDRPGWWARRRARRAGGGA